MIKHNFIEWVERTGCYLIFDIKAPYHYAFLSLKKPVVKMNEIVIEEITEISNLLLMQETEWTEGQFVAPPVIGIKKYSVIDWVRWLSAPVTVEIETDRNFIEHVEYYVYSGDTQTCITPFVKE